MSFHYSPRVITNGLVFYFDPANEKSLVSGTTSYLDLSNNRYSGTLMNGCSFSSNSFGTLFFDGTNDFVLLNYTQSIGTDNLTVIIWLNFSTNQRSSFFDKGTGSGSRFAISIANDINNSVAGSRIVVNDVFLTTFRNYMSTATFSDGIWHNFAVVRDTSESKYYIDGILSGSTVGSKPNLSNSAPVRFGNAAFDPSAAYNGFLGPVFLYDRALSGSEVLQNFNTLKNRFGI